MPKQIGRKKLNVTNKPLHNINLIQDAYQPPKIGRVNVFKTIDHAELKEQRAETAIIKAANRRAISHPRKMSTNVGGLNRAYGDASVIYKHESQQYAIAELFKKFGTNFAGSFTTDNQKAAFTNQAPENADPFFFSSETPHGDNNASDIPFEFPFSDEAEIPSTPNPIKEEMKKAKQAKKREAYVELIEKHYATVKTGAKGRPKYTLAQAAQAKRQRADRIGMGAEDTKPKHKNSSLMSDATDNESPLSSFFR